MKMKYIKYCLLAASISLGSCSSEYLDTLPTNETSPDTAFGSTANVKMAINGIAKIMTTQHLSSQGFNGEGTIKMYYGEYPGANFRVDLAGWAVIINGQYYENINSIYNYYPWHYYYMIISNANEIVARIDGVDGPVAEKQYLKAQALSYRAYAYTMLVQLYGYSWDKSQNGEFKALPLRLDPSQDKDLPLSSMKDVYATIYDDLDEAINLFTQANYTRKANYEIDASVAHAIYARAALNKQDYPKAQAEAAMARAAYPLMSVADYKKGFSNPTGEWIWSSYGASDEQLYYYSYFAYIGYNSNASAVRNYPKRISKEFFETIPNTDIRKGLFLDPTGYDASTYNATTGVAKNGSPMDQYVRDNYEFQSNAKVAAYMQLKIKNNDNPGVGNMNHFRSSEMVLIEAEAKLHTEGPAAAKAMLAELNKDRDPNYDANAVADAKVFDEIVKYRGLELWGEGFDWFDHKRWNKAIVRKSVEEGGNYNVSLAKTIEPTQGNNWTWKTPSKESDFNDALE